MPKSWPGAQLGPAGQVGPEIFGTEILIIKQHLILTALAKAGLAVAFLANARAAKCMHIAPTTRAAMHGARLLAALAKRERHRERGLRALVQGNKVPSRASWHNLLGARARGMLDVLVGGLLLGGCRLCQRLGEVLGVAEKFPRFYAF